MARRRLTIKRLDPWSVLKFGAVVNLALLAVGLLVFAVAWFIVQRLGIIEQACDIADQLGFQQCGINGSNLFRAVVLLGLLWVVIQTAVLVFLSFLHNLIADLTGGLTITVIDDSPTPARQAVGPAVGTVPLGATGEPRYVADPRRPSSRAVPPASTAPSQPSRSEPTQPSRSASSSVPSQPSRTAPPPVPPLGRDQPAGRRDPVAPQGPDDRRSHPEPPGGPGVRGDDTLGRR